MKRISALILALALTILLVGCETDFKSPILGINSYSSDVGSDVTTSTSSEDNTITSSDIGDATSSKPVSDTNNTTTDNNDKNNNNVNNNVNNDNNDDDNNNDNNIGNNDYSSEAMYSYTQLADSKRYCLVSGVMNERQKLLYYNIRNAVRAKQLSLDIAPSSAISDKDVELAFHCVNTDFPEFYWMKGGYTLHLNGNNIVTKIVFEYLPFNDVTDADFNKIVEGFVDSLPAGLTEYEVELRAHDYLCQTITYDSASAAGSTANQYAYSAYGALVTKSCVCEGYSRAMQLLMNRVGIQCGLVRGTSNGGGHMWNIIKINGSWYQLDVTWDDPIGAKRYNHFYFNLTTEEITSMDHAIDPTYAYSQTNYNVKMYPCVEVKYNYFVMSNTYLDGSDDRAAVVDALKKAKKNGEKCCEIKAISGSALYDIGDSKDAQNALQSWAAEAGIRSFSIIVTDSDDRFMICW